MKNNRGLKIAGVLLLVLLLVWAVLVFFPKVAASVIPSEETRANLARVVVALIAIIVAYVVAILAIPILLKLGLIVALGAVVYFAFRGLFKPTAPEVKEDGNLEK